VSVLAADAGAERKREQQREPAHRSGVARRELYHEVALQRLGNAEERVDARRAAPALETRDRRLRRPAKLGELALGKAHLAAPFGDAIGDLREEPATVARDDLLVEPLHRPLPLEARIRRHTSNAMRE
jgi:hypothetical protein